MRNDIDLKAYIKDYVEPTAEERAVWEDAKLKHLQQAQERQQRIDARFEQVDGFHHISLDDSDYSVAYDFEPDTTSILIDGGIDNSVFLTPKHALRLLVWLQEQQASLEQLAKEIEE